MVADLFEPLNVSSVRLANRFVRSATWEGMATKEGAPDGRLNRLMEVLARGEVGMIITGSAFVNIQGKSGVGQLGADRDELIPALSEMTRSVHLAGGKIFMQLNHGGAKRDISSPGIKSVAPSAQTNPFGDAHEGMSLREVRENIDAFTQAAIRAQKAGFDGVQLHGAHGYLINQFLSPLCNQRKDQYGGSLENRARFLLEVLKQIRDELGPDYPVLIKLAARDIIPGGLTMDEALQVALWLEREGLCSVEVSCGIVEPGQPGSAKPGLKEVSQEAYFRSWARRFKQQLDIPVILVGGIKSFEVARDVLEKDDADAIAMCRPLICEPGLIKRWREGDRRRANCVSDNLCFKPVRAGEGLYCLTRKRQEIA